MSKPLLDFFLHIRSLMTVGRFSVYKCHFREDVAQHSFFTSLYAMILADIERQNGREIDMEKLLRIGLLHDLEEARTGDVHHPFKHQDKEFGKMINSKAFEWYKKLLEDLPLELKEQYVKIREQKEKETPEMELIHAADKLEALLWAYEEWLLGNESLKDVVKDILEKLKQIDISVVQKLTEEISKEMEKRNP